MKIGYWNGLGNYEEVVGELHNESFLSHDKRELQRLLKSSFDFLGNVIFTLLQTPHYIFHFSEEDEKHFLEAGISLEEYFFTYLNANENDSNVTFND